MVKKQVKKTNKQLEKQQQQERVDNFARVLQIVAIIGVVAIVIVGQLAGKDQNPVPIWIPAGLMGVAIGISPDQFVDLIKAFFMGRKK